MNAKSRCHAFALAVFKVQQDSIGRLGFIANLAEHRRHWSIQSSSNLFTLDRLSTGKRRLHLLNLKRANFPSNVVVVVVYFQK
ncbi:Enniatin synthase [Trichinella pseudospiralis]